MGGYRAGLCRGNLVQPDHHADAALAVSAGLSPVALGISPPVRQPTNLVIMRLIPWRIGYGRVGIVSSTTAVILLLRFISGCRRQPRPAGHPWGEATGPTKGPQAAGDNIYGNRFAYRHHRN